MRPSSFPVPWPNANFSDYASEERCVATGGSGRRAGSCAPPRLQCFSQGLTPSLYLALWRAAAKNQEVDATSAARYGRRPCHRQGPLYARRAEAGASLVANRHGREPFPSPSRAANWACGCSSKKARERRSWPVLWPSARGWPKPGPPATPSTPAMQVGSCGVCQTGDPRE